MFAPSLQIWGLKVLKILLAGFQLSPHSVEGSLYSSLCPEQQISFTLPPFRRGQLLPGLSFPLSWELFNLPPQLWQFFCLSALWDIGSLEDTKALVSEIKLKAKINDTVSIHVFLLLVYFIDSVGLPGASELSENIRRHLSQKCWQLGLPPPPRICNQTATPWGFASGSYARKLV